MWFVLVFLFLLPVVCYAQPRDEAVQNGGPSLTCEQRLVGLQALYVKAFSRGEDEAFLHAIDKDELTKTQGRIRALEQQLAHVVKPGVPSAAGGVPAPLQEPPDMQPSGGGTP